MPKKKITTEFGVEIVVATYWPTRIIKEITIKDTRADNWHDSITLSAKDARYLFAQLSTLYSSEGAVDES